MAEAEDDLVIAGELALGVLTGADRAEARRRRLAEPAFAEAVAWWEERLAALSASVPPARVRESVWHAIDRRLDARDAAAPVVVPVDIGGRVRRWQWSTAGAGAIAAALAVALVAQSSRPPAPTPAPVIVAERPTAPSPAPTAEILPAAVAQLSSEEGEPLLVVSYNAAAHQLTVRSRKLPAGVKAPELWIIPADGTPRSLGLIRPDGRSVVTLDPKIRPLVGEEPVLAVTLEHPETAPHDAPTGDILASGKILRI